MVNKAQNLQKKRHKIKNRLEQKQFLQYQIQIKLKKNPNLNPSLPDDLLGNLLSNKLISQNQYETARSIESIYLKIYNPHTKAIDPSRPPGSPMTDQQYELCYNEYQIIQKKLGVYFSTLIDSVVYQKPNNIRLLKQLLQLL